MAHLRSFLLLCVASASVVGLAACGGSDEANTPTSAATPAADGSAVTAASSTLAAPMNYTKNTTRVNASDAVAVAATTALTMFPSTAKDLRPDAVTFAGSDDWRSILLAAPFAAKPLGYPVLLISGTTIPAATTSALKQLQPPGSQPMNDAQGLRLNVTTKVPDLRTRYLTSTTPAGLSAVVDRQLSKARGKVSSRVMVVNSEDETSAAPAAAWAAKSGDPILFTGAGTLPAATKTALQAHNNPRIYVLGGPDTVSRFVISQLQEFGTVRRIAPDTPGFSAAQLSIEFAKYSDTDFGFNFNDAGHGLVFASTSDPTSAMAAAGLSSGGTYGAMLYVDRPDHVEAPLRSYLLDIQPGFNDSKGVPATAAVYNRGWIIGDQGAIETSTQARLDQLLEVVKTDDAAPISQTPTDTGVTP
jgi:hypothetical protein